MKGAVYQLRHELSARPRDDRRAGTVNDLDRRLINGRLMTHKHSNTLL